MKNKIRWYKYQIYVLLILSPSFLFTSPNKFAKTFGGSSGDIAHVIQQTPDGGYILAGGTTSFGSVYQDFLVLKLNLQGDLEWARTFVGYNDENVWSIYQTSDGGYILGGDVFLYNVSDYNFLVLKLSHQFDIEWTRTFGGSNYDQLRGIQQTLDGGYILAGHTKSFGAGDYDILVLKLDSQGNLEWVRTFGGSNGEFFHDLQQTPDGGYILAGHTISGLGDFLLLKLDSQGNLEWAKTYGGGVVDVPHSIQQTSDGGYILAGVTNSFGAGSGDFFLLKIDSQGNIEWAKTYGGSANDWANSIQQTSDGGYILTGGAASFGGGNSDFLILKSDSQGNLEWAKTFGGSNLEDAYGVQQTSDGGYILAGTTQSFGAGHYDFLVLKLDTDGSYTDCAYDCQPTVTSPTPSMNSISLTITSPSLIVQSYSMFSSSLLPSISDVCTPLGEYELPSHPSKDKEISSPYLLWFDAYYSPYSNSIIIKYRMNKESVVNLALYDLSGNLLKSIYSGSQEKGYHKFDVKIKENPGIYFIKLNINKSIFTRKITILK